MPGISSNTPSPPHVDPAATPSYQTLTGLGVGVTVVAALYFGKDILLPIIVAILLSFVLSPLVGALRRLEDSAGRRGGVLSGVRARHNWRCGCIGRQPDRRNRGRPPAVSDHDREKGWCAADRHSGTHWGGRKPFPRDAWPGRSNIASICIAGGRASGTAGANARSRGSASTAA